MEKSERQKKVAAAKRMGAGRRVFIAFISVLLCASIVFSVVYPVAIAPLTNYQTAVKLYLSGEYVRALSIFEALGDYKDSKEKIELCYQAINEQNYQAAVKLYLSGEYEKALSIFEALGEYKDSKEKIELCKQAMQGQEEPPKENAQEQDYQAAEEFYRSGEYEKAIAAFEALGDYKDSKERITLCKIAELKNTQVGQTFFFGTYEQDGDEENGKEPIEWQVLKTDKGGAFVISKYALDRQEYDPDFEEVTWENSYLRNWLNTSFYNKAFGEEEKKFIRMSYVTADEDLNYSPTPANDTWDNIYLLSYNEAVKFFPTAEEKKCIPTRYALSQDAYTKADENGNEICWWWLRTPGYDRLGADYVDDEGAAISSGTFVFFPRACVRPVLWINFS